MNVCTYCGEAATTVDHVPPRGLIRSSRRLNLWTVPSCERCNGGSSRDEEYFRMMVIGAFCHTPEADELFDGPISRSMDHRPAKEDWLFGAFGTQDGLPFVELVTETLERVACKIVTGLACKLSADPALANAVVTLDEIEGRGEHVNWAPDFSFTKTPSHWELWFFDSVRVIVRPACLIACANTVR